MTSTVPGVVGVFPSVVVDDAVVDVAVVDEVLVDSVIVIIGVVVTFPTDEVAAAVWRTGVRTVVAEVAGGRDVNELVVPVPG